MITLEHEISKSQSISVLPSSRYLSRERFFCKYENTTELGKGLISPILYPIPNVLCAVGYACRALWAALRAIGNLFIIQPKAALSAVQEFGVHFLLTLAHTLLAPIHALSYSAELLTRLVSSWFIGGECAKYLSRLGISEIFYQEINAGDYLLPSAHYLKQAKFFSKYENVLSFLKSFLSHLGYCMGSVLVSCLCVLESLLCAIDGVANFVLCNPIKGMARIINSGIYASLAISFAVIAPINAIVYGLAFLSRLGATCVNIGEENTTEPLLEMQTDICTSFVPSS